MISKLNNLALDDDCGVLGKGCDILEKYGYSGYGLYYQKHVDFAIQDGFLVSVGKDLVDEGSGKPWLDDVCATSAPTFSIKNGEFDVQPNQEYDYRCHCPDPELQGGGNLTITVLEARGLPDLDGFGLAGGATDAYLRIKIGTSVRTTSFARNSNNPRWQSEYDEYLHEKQLENSYCRFIHNRFQETRKWSDGDCEQDVNFDYNKGCSVEDPDACGGRGVNFGVKQSGSVAYVEVFDADDFLEGGDDLISRFQMPVIWCSMFEENDEFPGNFRETGPGGSSFRTRDKQSC